MTCGHMKVSKSFTSTVTGKTFESKGYVNCNTPLVIHLITCLKCSKQYVGCTTAERSNVTKHFTQCNCGDIAYFSVQGIEKVRLGIRGGDPMRIFAKREVFWIFHLRTRLPLGLNYEFESIFKYH
ncbi:hypothetical protein XELAEV_18042246mg [Xenopus laevis]|uniref:Uncharacterized protein n=1 Tax=Xenopus laevis TaxID=8355 RepID=A0A974C3P6_XENLA|nr:hypothetical protein XELAEV_18042246mg [Xenopus laevis]